MRQPRTFLRKIIDHSLARISNHRIIKRPLGNRNNILAYRLCVNRWHQMEFRTNQPLAQLPSYTMMGVALYDALFHTDNAPYRFGASLHGEF